MVCIAMVGWIGYSAYDLVTREDPNAEQEVVTTEMDVTALTDYLSSLSQDGYRIGRNLPGKSKPRCLHVASGFLALAAFAKWICEHVCLARCPRE